MPRLELPPWMTFPEQEPWWGGWRQGTSEAWLFDQWLPFWKSLDDVGRRQYLIQYPPPTEDWREYLEKHWT